VVDAEGDQVGQTLAGQMLLGDSQLLVGEGALVDTYRGFREGSKVSGSAVFQHLVLIGSWW